MCSINQMKSTFLYLACLALASCTIVHPPSGCSPYCSQGTRCINNYCKQVEHGSGSLKNCFDDSQCLATETCRDGQCRTLGQNRCQGCKINQKCVYGKCIINDKYVSPNACVPECSYNEECKDGQCYPTVSRCRSKKDCLQGQVCKGRKCVAAPFQTCYPSCGTGYQCVHGQCAPIIVQVPVTCWGDSQCQSNEICHQGKCIIHQIEDKCSNCQAGTKCVNNQSVPDINVCPAEEPYKATMCPTPRPNQQTCPQVFYIRAPDYAYCGVRADGTKVDFFEECTACKDTSIVYYFDKPCHKTPFVCGPEQTCNGEYCTKGCQKDAECPYDWQVCYQNQCVSDCYLKRCRDCHFSRCFFEQPNQQCFGGEKCRKDYWQCVGFQCVDPCTRKPCPAFYKCDNGECVPQNPPIY